MRRRVPSLLPASPLMRGCFCSSSYSSSPAASAGRGGGCSLPCGFRSLSPLPALQSSRSSRASLRPGASCRDYSGSGRHEMSIPANDGGMISVRFRIPVGVLFRRGAPHETGRPQAGSLGSAEMSDGTRMEVAAQASAKALSLLDRAGRRSFSSARASICLIRSRVTPNN
jgi:hypothetical protein